MGKYMDFKNNKIKGEDINIKVMRTEDNQPQTLESAIQNLMNSTKPIDSLTLQIPFGINEGYFCEDLNHEYGEYFTFETPHDYWTSRPAAEYYYPRRLISPIYAKAKKDVLVTKTNWYDLLMGIYNSVLTILLKTEDKHYHYILNDSYNVNGSLEELDTALYDLQQSFRSDLSSLSSDFEKTNVAADGSYVKTTSVPGVNISALDTQLKKVSDQLATVVAEKQESDNKVKELTDKNTDLEARIAKLENIIKTTEGY